MSKAKSKTNKSKKNYEVLITGYSNVLVIEATSEDEALELAENEISSGDFNIESLKIVKEIKDEDLEQARSSANVVSEE